MGGVNLEALLAEPSVADTYAKWKKVAEALEQKQMPPAKVKQPSDAERTAASSWVRSRLNEYAKAHAGDPGKVTVRQLTAGEYNFAIEDLTGLKLNLERDASADSVGGEGFTNYGDTQFMQDSTLERYLESAKRVASHAVIGSGPLQFFIDPGKSGLEYSAISRIRHIYDTYGFRASSGEGGKPYNLDFYGRAFHAAYRYHNRVALGMPKATWEQISKEEKISARLSEHLYNQLQTPNPTYPLSEAVKLWKEMPKPGTGNSKDAAKKLQDFVINYPRWVFGAGAWAEGGRGDERNFLITEASLTVRASGKLRGFNRGRPGREAKFYIMVVDLNPTAAKPARVQFKNASIRFRKRDRSASDNMPIVSVLDEASKTKFGISAEAGSMDFTVPANQVLPISVKTPEEVFGTELAVEVALPEEYKDSVIRVTVSDEPEINKGTPFSVILGFDKDPGYQAWKKNVLAFSDAMPQNSHAEATPADKDVIPPPFDNTYNQPERDRFHVKVKYHRDDRFIADKILDTATRKQLDEAWNDILGSFEYHDIFFDFVEEKFKLNFKDRTIASLKPAEIAAIPAEPRKYVVELRKNYDAIQAAFQKAQPGHINDAMAFAENAWRRPLTLAEKDSLRRFYTNSRANSGNGMKLDHDKAMRALIARILVAPAFLYRVEQQRLTSASIMQPVSLKSGDIKLTPYELASRLSFFLWSSIPDAELRRAAASGELDDPKKIASQVDRMLTDPKASRLSSELFGQWLGFYRFDHYTGIDQSRFPEFNDELKQSLYKEATSLFDYIVREKRPLREMFTADYTFLNKRLAEHYGAKHEFKPGTEKTMVKVDNASAFHRGGMLTLGAVHVVTSAPLRTSPVKRGDWLLRRVFGTPTPPPPPDAGMLPADDKKFAGQTMRERLLAHQRNATCAGCHSRIDPLGFPLEKYDPVGRWRDNYADGQAIYDSGDLKDKKIPGIEGLKQHLTDKEALVMQQFSRKVLGFALGRTVIGSDDPLLEEIAATGGQQTFASLATKLATSKQFRYRRADAPANPAKPATPNNTLKGAL